MICTTYLQWYGGWFMLVLPTLMDFNSKVNSHISGEIGPKLWWYVTDMVSCLVDSLLGIFDFGHTPMIFRCALQSYQLHNVWHLLPFRSPNPLTTGYTSVLFGYTSALAENPAPKTRCIHTKGVHFCAILHRKHLSWFQRLMWRPGGWDT